MNIAVPTPRAAAVVTVERFAPRDDEPPPYTEIPDYADRERDDLSEVGWLADRAVRAPAPAPKFAPVAIDDVVVSAEPPWLIDGLLPARGLAFIVGPPKSGKSFFASHMMCSVARGALAGSSTPDSVAVPHGLRAAGRNDLKRYLQTAAWQDGAGERSWSAQLSNGLSRLRDRGLIGFDREWVWMP